MSKMANSNYVSLCDHLRTKHGERLAFNSMNATPCLDGAPLTDVAISRMREQVEIEGGIVSSHSNIQRALLQVAGERPFHPVKRYLRGLVWDGEERIGRLTTQILHAKPTPDSQDALRRWFVSAAARAIEPGCGAGPMLLLGGSQGVGKTMFFEVLGGEWFSDARLTVTSGRAQPPSAWIHEWADFDMVITRRNAGTIKAFLAARHDRFRPPFGHNVIEHPRSAVIVGTICDEALLDDVTDARRFLTLKAKDRIDLRLLRAWRDQLWAEAVDLFDAGERPADG